MKTFRGLFFVLFCTSSPVFAETLINAWTNPGSAPWEGASNWSLGVRPASNQTVVIANAGYKAVGISSSTISGYPASLTVSNLTLSAPSSALSTLLLNYAGTSVPLHVLDVCTIGANGSLQNFYSSFQVDGSNGVYYGGSFVINDGAQFIQEGGLTVIKPTVELYGTINATNATMNLGALNLGDDFTGRPGNVTQSGGTVQIANLRIHIGRYTLLDNGILYSLDSTILYEPSADFEQIGGTNYGDVEVRAGLYKLHGGLLHGNDLSTTGDPSGGEGFFQYGGTAEFATIEVQGPESAAYPWISYSLQGGALHCGNLSISGVGSMQELGGTMTLTNGLDLEHGTFNLYGGSLSMPSLVVSNAGRFTHIDGINIVAGDVALYNTSLKFQAGRFSSVNLGVGVGASVDQFSGSNEVSGVLSIVGSYLLNGGVLSVNGMYLRGTLSIGQGGSPPASFVNDGLINFGGILNIAASQNSMGQLGLSANGTINLGASPLVVRIADSHALNWDSNSRLVIAGWNGSYYGNGSNQVFFGSSASGLTASQLAQIQFSNPSGYASGNYPAQLLSTGELVPAVAPGPPPGLVNSWTNPASGYWEELKWSLGVRPGTNQTIMLTNQGWKAIAIGPSTSQNFPETLDVSSVILGGYTDSFNTLLLNYAGFEVPLTTGSINVGSNSAVTALASVLHVAANGSGAGDISIFSVFNQGEQAIVNAGIINLGNLSNPAAGPGTYNQTNGSISAGAISGWNGSTFNQFDGANNVSLLYLGGANGNNVAHYNIASGSLTAGSIELQRGDFNQTGGSVTAGLALAAATYTLSAGTLQLPGITIPKAHYGPQNPNGMMGMNATLLQTGGTNFCDGAFTVYNEYGAPGVPVAGFGPGRYILSNGVLCVSSTVRSWLSSFEQWGGWHTNAGTQVDGGVYPGFEIRTGSFTLGGGTLITPSISINLGYFTQSAGTNCVSGDVGVGTGRGLASFNLAGGLLTALNTSLDASSTAAYNAQHAAFIQSGGTHIVTNLLRLSGPPPDYLGNLDSYSTTAYVLNGGVLNVPNIQLALRAVFDHEGGTLITSGLLNLGIATWSEKTSGQQFGQLLLSAPAGSNASFSLPSGNCVVRFANCSSVTWSNQATLFVDNWNGSLSGGGQHQFIFGSSSSGVTPQQISQIQFRNPAGVSGIFPARILSTGEIVPDRFLAAHEASNNLMIEWSSGTLQSATNVTGPYQNVTGATTPYAAPFTGPQRFFRLKE